MKYNLDAFETQYLHSFRIFSWNCKRNYIVKLTKYLFAVFAERWSFSSFGITKIVSIANKTGTGTEKNQIAFFIHSFHPVIWIDLLRGSRSTISVFNEVFTVLFCALWSYFFSSVYSFSFLNKWTRCFHDNLDSIRWKENKFSIEKKGHEF